MVGWSYAFSYSGECVFLCRVTDAGRSAFKAGRSDSLNVKTLERQQNE